MKTVDLHTHTTYSDGTCTPSELFSLARKAGLSAIAVTDHDTVSGWTECAAAERASGVKFIRGIELSTNISDYEVDILGINLTKQTNKMLDFLRLRTVMRNERNKKMVERLNGLGIEITFDDVKSFASSDIIARPHIARALIAKGCCKTVRDAFRTYLSPGCPAYVKKESPEPRDVIGIIAACGGVSVLAHPVIYTKKYPIGADEIENMLKALVPCGLSGIEAYYPVNTEKDEADWLRLSRQYNIKTSGGSDFHGSVKPDNHLGVPVIPVSVLENLII